MYDGEEKREEALGGGGGGGTGHNKVQVGEKILEFGHPDFFMMIWKTKTRKGQKAYQAVRSMHCQERSWLERHGVSRI